jgi:hypothetical protein
MRAAVFKGKLHMCICGSVLQAQSPAVAGTTACHLALLRHRAALAPVQKTAHTFITALCSMRQLEPV